MANDLYNLMATGHLENISAALTADSRLANAGVTLSCGDGREGHPLHRLCDAVFAGLVTDEQAIGIAKVLLDNGADVDGYKRFVHSLMSNDTRNLHHQLQCIKLLLKAGASKASLGDESLKYLRTVAENDAEVKTLLL